MLKFDKEKNTLTNHYKGKKIELNYHVNCTEKDLEILQIQIATMLGGNSMLANIAITEPDHFDIDPRLGKMPFSANRIYDRVELLKAVAFKLGLDTTNLPNPLTKTTAGWIMM